MQSPSDLRQSRFKEVVLSSLMEDVSILRAQCCVSANDRLVALMAELKV